MKTRGAGNSTTHASYSEAKIETDKKEGKETKIETDKLKEMEKKIETDKKRGERATYILKGVAALLPYQLLICQSWQIKKGVGSFLTTCQDQSERHLKKKKKKDISKS